MNSLPFLALLALVCGLSTVSAQTPTGFPTTLAPTAGQTVDKCDQLHGQAGIECKLGLSDLSAGGSGAETNALINLFIIFCCCSPLIGLGCFVLCAPGFGILLLVKGLAGTVHTSEVGERVTDISILGNGPFFFISALKLPMLYVPKMYVIIAIVLDFMMMHGAAFVALGVLAKKKPDDPTANGKNWITVGIIFALAPFGLQLLTGFTIFTVAAMIFLCFAWLHAMISLLRTILPNFNETFAKYFDEQSMASVADTSGGGGEVDVELAVQVVKPVE